MIATVTHAQIKNDRIVAVWFPRGYYEDKDRRKRCNQVYAKRMAWLDATAVYRERW